MIKMRIQHQGRQLAILTVDSAGDIAGFINGHFIKSQPFQFGSYQLCDVGFLVRHTWRLNQFLGEINTIGKQQIPI